MKIAMVTGHDMDSQGAYGNLGISEFMFMDDLLSEMRSQRIFPPNHEYAHFYRHSDIKGYTNKMKNLHKRIDNWGADVSIEFHFNSFSDPEVKGNEVLYCSEGGKRVADIFDEALDSLPNRDRGVKKVTGNDRGAGFCCRGKSYAIILEPFFGSSQNDYVRGGRYRSSLMEAIKTGLERV